MSTDTPTPRTDSAPKAAYRDAMFCELVSADFARTLERELTAMTARAEAAEAACVEKDKALNACAFPNYCGGEKQVLLEVMESRQNFARLALLLTPAETRSVIAGLREDEARLDWTDSNYNFIIRSNSKECEIDNGEIFAGSTLRQAIDAARKVTQ